MSNVVRPERSVGVARARLVIAASSIGTVFEWYDFFLFGTMAPLIGRLFFPGGSETAQFLLVLASFGVGFGMRPLGAVLFGYFGDRLGRKYTFLFTVTMMGLATAAVGLVPTFAELGNAAPALLVLLRVIQGLAIGGEYGGAALYVAEHAPADRRGFYTSFIQTSVIGGFLLSLVVTLAVQAAVPAGAWEQWGWRLPFLLSLLLLAVSLWMRLRMQETPIFRAMRASGRVSHNPLRDSFADGANVRRMLVVLFGVAAGLTVVWYTSQFGALYFLQSAQRLDDGWARGLVGIGAVISLGWFLLFGRLSDRYGRKPFLVAGYGLTLLLLFPLFHMMASAANPAMKEAARRAPVIVSGPNCHYHPFALRGQPTECARILDHLAGRGVMYTKARTPGVAVTVGGVPVADRSAAGLDAALTRGGWSIAKVRPSLKSAAVMLLGIVLLGMLSGMTYGPVAALLPELFPARVRYTSASIPYHVGTGYFGGFLPFISQYIVARAGTPYAGLWYTMAVVLMALIVTILFLPETRGVDLDEDAPRI
ncbi:MFS transporter [Sphingomonas morindae]|uniref:MFS transporter n=1 Tax=Sphingomonas morindae TaxID=1541170 RepID=A0ABY4XAN2_9SPHN|nr:MFS transporter [Sphingomonas morindae]USI74027.1 MFS transporter [Sphingomonas morindae]